MTMVFNECKTCGAKDGRAGILINNECRNCYDTRKSGDACVHTDLLRSDIELQRTFEILNQEAV